MSEPKLVYSSKINKARSFALILILAGVLVMYGGLLLKKIPWLMLTLFLIGVVFIVLSTVVYFWIGLLSTRTISVICPNCERQTKMLGRVDACMHCKEPLTMDQNLEGEDFDEKYNSRHYRRKLREEAEAEQNKK